MFILLKNLKKNPQGKTGIKVHLKDPARSEIDAEQQMPIFLSYILALIL